VGVGKRARGPGIRAVYLLQGDGFLVSFLNALDLSPEQDVLRAWLREEGSQQLLLLRPAQQHQEAAPAEKTIIQLYGFHNLLL
jgi:hypothetical protein